MSSIFILSQTSSGLEYHPWDSRSTSCSTIVHISKIFKWDLILVVPSVMCIYGIDKWDNRQMPITRFCNIII